MYFTATFSRYERPRPILVCTVSQKFSFTQCFHHILGGQICVKYPQATKLRPRWNRFSWLFYTFSAGRVFPLIQAQSERRVHGNSTPATNRWALAQASWHSLCPAVGHDECLSHGVAFFSLASVAWCISRCAHKHTFHAVWLSRSWIHKWEVSMQYILPWAGVTACRVPDEVGCYGGFPVLRHLKGEEAACNGSSGGAGKRRPACLLVVFFFFSKEVIQENCRKCTWWVGSVPR